VIATTLDAQELMEGWSATDPQRRARAAFPLFAAHGTKSTATVYFEVQPGDHLGRHTDSAEEILLILAGEGEAVVGDDRTPVAAGSLALVPELVPHDVYATGTETLKVIGFFSAAEVESVFNDPMQPMGERVLGTPPVAALA
jgi:quercetin dioxygenase-like cupin family protein